MPIYEFHCPACGRDFEELVFNSREQVLCPDCGRGDCKKLMSAACFRSKGADGAAAVKSAGGGCAGCAGASCATCGH